MPLDRLRGTGPGPCAVAGVERSGDGFGRAGSVGAARQRLVFSFRLAL